MSQKKADLYRNSNNNTAIVWPAPDGRLARLYQEAPNRPRVWCFGNNDPFMDDDGIERVDHRRRGVLVGDHNDYDTFIALCRSLGLVVAFGNGYVPCSNSQRLRGRTGDQSKYDDLFDYYDHELQQVRVDLPTKEQLRAILTEVK